MTTHATSAARAGEPLELDAFEVLKELGEGGFGRVFAVRDRERGDEVALKLLSHTDPRTLLSFKQEFRGLADMVHPNLVTLYELHEHDGQWFFTMEWVRDGADFLAYVREAPPAPAPHDTQTRRSSMMSDVLEAQCMPAGLEEATLEASWFEDLSYNEGRLREALRQLYFGISALHDANILHRDIKPSNILVTPQDRVVLLDFGLITEHISSSLITPLQKSARNRRMQFAGTPHYMSPEQAMAMPLSPASDWYALGSVLYEVLTGRRPVEGGSALQILLRKQSVRPAHVLELAPDAPQDLATLCMRLLERQPLARPDSAELAALIGVNSSHHAAPRRVVARHERRPFVGRAQHLATLRRALDDLGETQAARFVNVVGRSGMGKSALLRKFLGDLSAQTSDVLVLQGRCFENETVPYKVLDQLIDLLGRYLDLLPTQEVEAMSGVDWAALAQLFPTLSRLKIVEALSDQERSGQGDAQQRRRRAFEALRRLLTHLASERALVLYIDDVQWGDEDSVALIEHVMRPPDAPAMLLLTSFREEDRAHSTFLQHFFAAQRNHPGDRVVELEVSALSAGDAEQLATQLLSDAGAPPARQQLERIAQEAGGHPLFIDELARYLRTHSEPSSGLTNLEDVLFRRIKELPDSARRLLEIISVAGQPLERQLARSLATLDRDEQAAFALLRSELFVRQSSDMSQPGLETYHARIRETLIARMQPDALIQTHASLAHAFAQHEGADAELIAHHFMHARQTTRALPYLRRAAEQASAALAFERAARLWESLLEHGAWGEQERREIHERLGETYGYLGKGNEAARAYISAYQGSEGASARTYYRLAAEQLLRAGQFERGRDMLTELLASMNIRAPRGTRMFIGLLAMRARIAMRNLSKLTPQTITAPQRERLELEWCAAQLLSATDLIAGAYFGALHTLDSMSKGDLYHASLALALEAIHVSIDERGRARAPALIERAHHLALQSGRTYAQSFASFGEAMCAYLAGDWARAIDLLERNEEVLETRCKGIVWELDGSRLYRFFCYEMTGAFEHYTEQLPHLLDEATQRGDLLYITNWKIWSYRQHLAQDDPDLARRVLQEAITDFDQKNFLIQHLWFLVGSVNTALYQGRADQARELIEAHRSALKSSLLLKNETIAVFFRDLELRALLASASAQPDAAEHRRWMRKARAASKDLSSRSLGFARIMGMLGEAQLAHLTGEFRTCADLLQRAQDDAHRLGCSLHAYAAQWWRAHLLGKHAPERERLLKEVELWCEARTIDHPASMMQHLLPASAGPSQGPEGKI